MDDVSAPRRPAQSRERKPLLRPREAATLALLESLPCDLPDRRGELHDWTEQLVGNVRQWVNAKGIRRGMFAPPRLTRAQADAALRAVLSRMGEAA